MRLMLSLVLVLVIGLASAPAEAAEGGPPKISADAAILIESSTGTVLHSRNGFKPRAPASLTKIMTAIVAVESGRLDEVVQVPPEATRVAGSVAGLKPKDRYTLRSLLYALMLPSGNDAALAIAYHLAGGVKQFAHLMDEKAKAMGAVHSSFVNPHGLDETGHLTTAYDLALMSRYALESPVFAKVVGTRRARIDQVPSSKPGLQFENTNQLLWSYSPAEGVKTGTTSWAGKCLVAYAVKGRMRLIAVILNSRDRWGDATKLLDYGFESFRLSRQVEANQPWRTIPVSRGTADAVVLRAEKDLAAVIALKDHMPEQEEGAWKPDDAGEGIAVPVGDPGKIVLREVLAPSAKAPVMKGQPLGELQLWADGRLADRCLLVASRAIPRPSLPRVVLPLVKAVGRALFVTSHDGGER